MAEAKSKIAILTGGTSSERDISLQTGRCIEKALKIGGYITVLTDISSENLEILDDKSIDVFFIALHGAFGEDGRLQQILEAKNLCYTGSGPDASKLAMDKVAAKKYFSIAGVNVPAGIEFTKKTTIEQIELYLNTEKYVVKPINNGSSIGVEIVDRTEDAFESAKECLRQFGECMIEEFIKGREITVGILNGKALPIMEIVPKVEFYDYHAKYVDDNTEYLFDTITDAKLIDQINRDAIGCYTSLNCRGTARVDFLLTKENVPYALEINTIPGMTTHSCVPKAAEKMGISMTDLCTEIINQAIKDFKEIRNPQTINLVNGQKKKDKTKIHRQKT